MDRYVDPLVTNLKAMLGYRKFRKGTKAEVDDLLRMEKAEYHMRIVYCFGISHEHPGTFILSYIRNSNPRHEYIGLYPKGFKFRKNMYESIDRLVAHFQKHIDDLYRDPVQSILSVAAMVPMRSPAPGGSSRGASVGGGWGGSAVNSSDGGWRGNANSDRDGSSTPASRTGRNDYRGGQDGHQSGVPRPYGRGRGRGSYHDRGNNSGGGHDSGYASSKWGSRDNNEGRSTYPGAKVQNSPGREAFPGGWGSSGGASGWGGGTTNNDNGAGNGWGGGGPNNDSGNAGGWGSGGGGGSNQGNSWGSSGGRGRGSRGRGGSTNYDSGNAGGRSAGSGVSSGGNGWGSSGGGSWSAGGVGSGGANDDGVNASGQGAVGGSRGNSGGSSGGGGGDSVGVKGPDA